MDPYSDVNPLYGPTCPTCFGADTAYASDYWAATNVQSHGLLGAEYPDRRWLKEGDSPSWFVALNNGLSFPEYPYWGGWGGRSTKTTQAGVRSVRDPLTAPSDYPEADSDPYYMYEADADTWGGYTSDQATIYRWTEERQNDFEARMDWTMQSSYGNANHAPIPIIDTDTSFSAHVEVASVTDNVIVDASGTYDPDSDGLTYLWWFYEEAGTYTGSVTINNSTTNTATIVVPGDASGDDIHVILSVTDDGSPTLTRYRRIIIDVN